MKIETRTFAGGRPEERRQMLFIPETEREKWLFDHVFGDVVRGEGHISDVTGKVQLSDGYGELYLRVESTEAAWKK